MTTKDKKDPYKEVAESLELGEGDGTPGFDSVSLDDLSIFLDIQVKNHFPILNSFCVIFATFFRRFFLLFLYLPA